MDIKAHARKSLETSRWLMESIIETLKDDDWFYQAHDKANHPLWIIGHLALADNMFGSQFREDKASKPDGWDDLFWFGSELKERSAYPAVDEVLAYFRDRREMFLAVLDDVTEEELAAPAPPEGAGSPIAGAPCIGHLFLFAGVHEAVHFGQLTVAHRGLGNPPLFTPGG